MANNFVLKLNYKNIEDSIYQNIEFSNLALLIVDTPEFQRLRNIKQLGICSLIYPTASHDRLQHSFGVYYLTGLILGSIKQNSDINEIKKTLVLNKETEKYSELNNWLIELIKIAGLCHDLGHGPLSHVFDNIFLSNKLINFPNHEERSQRMVEYIIKKYNIPIYNTDLELIKSIINPSNTNIGFVYQIVSNNLNNIDIDKFDYLTRDIYSVNFRTTGFNWKMLINRVRVIDNDICYPGQLSQEIYNMFLCRYRMHIQVYNHPVVISAEYMFADILCLIDSDLNLMELTNNSEKFSLLTDDLIFGFLKYKMLFKTNNSEEINKAISIYNRIQNRKLYKKIGKILLHIDKKEDISSELFHKYDSKINVDDVIVHKTEIGFVSGNKENPIDNTFIFNNYNKKIKLNSEDLSTFFNGNYQEKHIFIYSRSEDNDIINYITNIFNTIKDLYTGL